MHATIENLSRAAREAYENLPRATSLLATNAKLEKNAGAAADYLIAGLTLAPHTLALRGTENTLCPQATAGCVSACLAWFSGQRVTPQARGRALANTAWLLVDPEEFLCRLSRCVENHRRRATRLGLIPLVRLNVASDLNWTPFVAAHPDVVFYDYTKRPLRGAQYGAGEMPKNYHITFSASESTRPREWARFLRQGVNVAAVFDVLYQGGGRYRPWQKGALPESVVWDGDAFPVVDGDLHDVRLPHVDGRGVVVALRLKGTRAAKARARRSGFALAADGSQRVAESAELVRFYSV